MIEVEVKCSVGGGELSDDLRGSLKDYDEGWEWRPACIMVSGIKLFYPDRDGEHTLLESYDGGTYTVRADYASFLEMVRTYKSKNG